MGRRQHRFVAERNDIRPGAHRQADLLEPLSGEKSGAGPMGTFMYAESGERKEGDQGDKADGEHGERGENLRERQAMLLHEERPHAGCPTGKQWR
jgi:hypothetical protein